jgi:hypothetical protein
MDSVSTIKLNFERKDIVKIQFDRELIELNKETNNLRIHHIVALEIQKDVRLICDVVKILINNK